MKIASYNNPIQHNNILLRNDYQNRNVKYNTQDIEQDNFANYPNIGVLSNYAQVSFGLNVKPFYPEYINLIKNKNHFLKLITPYVKSSATETIAALEENIERKIPMIRKFLDDINNGRISCPVENRNFNSSPAPKKNYNFTSSNGITYWGKYSKNNNGNINIELYTNPNYEGIKESFIITPNGTDNNSYVIKDFLQKEFGDIEVCMAEYDIKGKELNECKMNYCTCSGDEPVSIQQITLRSDGKGYDVILESDDPYFNGKEICLKV